MAHALHSGFEPTTHHAARTFPRLAPDMLDIGELVEAFADALAQDGATGHRCHAVDAEGERIVLTHSHRPWSGTPDEMPWSGTPDESLSSILFSVDMPDDQPLFVTIDCPEAPDRHRRARLHTLAVIFATHAVTLIEAEDETPPPGAITPMERRCLHLLLAGLSHLDIGDRLDLSAPAVGIYLRRAATRLRASSATEACAIAMSRGLLT